MSHFCQSRQIPILYLYSNSSNSTSSNSSLRSIRNLFICPRSFLFGLFVICRFDSMFQRYSQLCLLLRDGLLPALSVVSSSVRRILKRGGAQKFQKIWQEQRSKTEIVPPRSSPNFRPKSGEEQKKKKVFTQI